MRKSYFALVFVVVLVLFSQSIFATADPSKRILMEDNFNDSSFNLTKWAVNGGVEPTENAVNVVPIANAMFWSNDTSFLIGDNVSVQSKVFYRFDTNQGHGFYRNSTAVIADAGGEPVKALCGYRVFHGPAAPTTTIYTQGTSTGFSTNPYANGSTYRLVINETGSQCEAWVQNESVGDWIFIVAKAIDPNEFTGNRSFIFGLIKGTNSGYGLAALRVLNLSIGEAGPPPEPTEIKFANVEPGNNTQFNNDTIAFNATINSTDNFTAYLFINGTLNISSNHSAGNNTPVNFSVKLNNGQYDFMWFANFTNLSGATTNVSSSNNTFFVDDVNPEISANFTNLSVVMQFNLSGNFNFTDEFMLFGYNVSIDGVVHESLTDLNVTFYQYNLSFYAGNFTVGRHNLSVSVSDGHTAAELGGDYGVSDGWFARYLEYDFWDYGYVNIREKGNSILNGFSTTRERDRYSFSFEPSTTANNYTFVVESDLPIHIIDRPDSQYGRWLIMGTHWLDFYMPTEKSRWLEFNRIDEYNVEVTVGGLSRKDRLDFSSIGDLNIVTAWFQFVTTNATVTYSSSVSELETQTIVLLINTTSDINWTNATLLWNGSVVDVVKTSFADYDHYNATFFTNGTGPAGENVTFVWQYNITGASTESGNISYVQEIFRIGVDNCSTFTTQAVNFTLVNESNSNPVNGSIEGQFSIWVDNVAEFREFDLTWGLGASQNTSYALCIDPPGAVYSISSQMEYGGTGFSTRTYYMTNLSISNVTQNITLFLTPDTSTVTFTVTDQNDNIVEGVLIFIEAYDIATDSSTLIQIVKTDGLGVALAELELNRQYKFRFVLDGLLIPFTDDAIWITSTSKNFRLNLVDDFFETYDVVNGVVCSLSYDNSTNNFTFTFTDPTGGVVNGCLKVTAVQAYSESIVNETCLSSASGTIVVSIGNSSINTTDSYVGAGRIFVGDSFFSCGDSVGVSFNTRWQTFGMLGVFMSFLLVVFLVMLGIRHPVLSVFLMTLGVIFSVAFDIFHMEREILVAFIILSGVTIVRLRRK